MRTLADRYAAERLLEDELTKMIAKLVMLRRMAENTGRTSILGEICDMQKSNTRALRKTIIAKNQTRDRIHAGVHKA